MSRFKPTERRGPTELRQAQCKEAALRVLQDFLVDAPNQIDLAAIAYKVGKLRIEEGGLDNADGRIVVPAEGMGTIRVKTGLDPNRRRFTIAHEIGHFELHPRPGLNCSDATDNLTIWNDPTEEAEANLFAGELLMPEFLLRPSTTPLVGRRGRTHDSKCSRVVRWARAGAAMPGGPPGS